MPPNTLCTHALPCFPTFCYVPSCTCNPVCPTRPPCTCPSVPHQHVTTWPHRVSSSTQCRCETLSPCAPPFPCLPPQARTCYMYCSQLPPKCPNVPPCAPTCLHAPKICQSCPRYVAKRAFIEGGQSQAWIRVFENRSQRGSLAEKVFTGGREEL